MPIDATVPGSAEWWLISQMHELLEQQDHVKLMRAYVCGNHPLPQPHKRYRETYRRLSRLARSNYVGLVTATVRERLRVVGFRSGGAADPVADARSWEVWQANSLDADQVQAHWDALVTGIGYVMVGGTDRETGCPVITVEDPAQVIHTPDPQRRRRVLSALKVWSDPLLPDVVNAAVFLPDVVARFWAPTPGAKLEDQSSWNLERYDPNPLGVVPIVPFINRPENGQGMSEFGDVLDIQDRINTTLLDRLVITAMQAFRQRWLKGADLTDEDGNPEQPFDPGADLLWAVESEKAQFGDFEQSSLAPVLDAIRSDMRDLAAISRTPPHYLTGELTNVNGATLDAAEAGLLAKVHDRQLEFGESWEQVARLAARSEGRQIGLDAEVIWAEPKSRSIAELADALAKLASIGAPLSWLLQEYGLSPQEIPRVLAEAEKQRKSDATTKAAAFGIGPGDQAPAAVEAGPPVQ